MMTFSTSSCNIVESDRSAGDDGLGETSRAIGSFDSATLLFYSALLIDCLATPCYVLYTENRLRQVSFIPAQQRRSTSAACFSQPSSFGCLCTVPEHFCSPLLQLAAAEGTELAIELIAQPSGLFDQALGSVISGKAKACA